MCKTLHTSYRGSNEEKARLFLHRLLPVLAFLFLVITPNANAEPLKVATFIYPPFIVEDPLGGLSGYSVDRARTTLKEAGFEAEITALPFSRMVASLEKGLIDAAFPLFYTADREAYAAFPTERLHTFDMVLLARRGAANTYDGTIASIHGKTVAWVRDTSTTSDFDQARVEKLIRVLPVASIDQQIRLVAVGRVDYSVGARHALEKGMRESKNGPNVQIAEPPIGIRNAYLVFSRTKAREAHIARIDGVLRRLNQQNAVKPD